MKYAETCFQQYQQVEYPRVFFGMRYSDLAPTELVGILSSATNIVLRQIHGAFYSTDALCAEMKKKLEFMAHNFAIGRYFEITDFILDTTMKDAETAEVYVSAVSPTWEKTSFGVRSRIIPLGKYTKKLYKAR